MQVTRFINGQKVAEADLYAYSIPLTATSVYDTIERVKARANKLELVEQQNEEVKKVAMVR